MVFYFSHAIGEKKKESPRYRKNSNSLDLGINNLTFNHVEKGKGLLGKKENIVKCLKMGKLSVFKHIA